ncbi:cytosine permease [Sinorhizobium mexicanum]|nr:cytosine permease [Sinorhizobium mexicanum]MBP1882467.1 purine-cytosine permease-like protein [Sinorhizobium mexicanum]
MSMQNPSNGKEARATETVSAIAEIESILSATEEDIADYTESVVPLEKRRSNFRMLAQFLSMQAVFGTVLVGYGARFQGLTLSQLIISMLIAVAVMSLYCLGSANAGAATGQTHSVMARSVFGTLGSALVSLLLIVNGMAFYLFTVKFVIDITGGLMTLPAVGLVTAVLAFVMIINTYFGFEGVQRFAQYIAVPVILIWGVYATIRAFFATSGDVLAAIPHVDAPTSMIMVTGALVGLSTWGNEPDFFRYAKVGRESLWNLPTIIVSYLVGALLFPVMGYMIAALSNQPDFGQSISYFVNFTMFGSALIGIAVIVINQWAVQDGNLYIAVNGAQNLLSGIRGWRRQYTVVALGLIATVLTFYLPNLQDTFNIVTGIGSTTVPVASTIMAIDLFLLPLLFGIKRPMHRVANWSELGIANWPGVIALAAGTLVGLYTAGLLPMLNTAYIGFPALQSWIVGGVVYIIGVAFVQKHANVKALLGFARI